MSSKNVGIEEARKTLGDLVTSVQQGAEIVLTRNGRPAARIVAVTAYTVEIQAGNEDGTIWQALHPAETVTDYATAEQAALDVYGNQTILERDDPGPWRIVVWDGADADTGAEPAYTLDDQQVRDETYVLANDDSETMTLMVNGDEVRQIHTTDGQVTSDTIAHAGPGTEDWVRECLADYRADGWA